VDADGGEVAVDQELVESIGAVHLSGQGGRYGGRERGREEGRKGEYAYWEGRREGGREGRREGGRTLETKMTTWLNSRASRSSFSLL
jgi:hypothetical protein